MTAGPDLSAILARAKAPATVTVSERWHLGLMSEAIGAEMRRAEGTLKRSKSATTKRLTTQRIEALRDIWSVLEATRKEGRDAA